MSENQFELWMVIASVVIAISFVVMALSLLTVALFVRKLMQVVHRVEEQAQPLVGQVEEIGNQGKEIAAQFNELSGHMVVASKNFSESTTMIKDEVRELKALVGSTAVATKEKVDNVSGAIERTSESVSTTVDFIGNKVVKPAAEIAALMIGIRKGLEVLFAPSPKRIDRAYHDNEMFIG